ncbi:MAG: ATP-binding protein [Bacillota bacterium]|nr:ATP-binding protein [Bacillota bacterium]
MKKHKSNIFLYLSIVVVPIILIGLYFFSNSMKNSDLERKKQALWIATIHEQNWDQLIGQTMTSLSILSILVPENLTTPNNMKNLFEQVHNKDPRYGGLYLLDPKGNVVAGSDDLYHHSNLSQIDYIHEAIDTKDSVISNHQESLRNQKIIGLATPVFDQKHSLIGFLIAHLRFDYMLNLMEELTPEAKICVMNSHNHIIMKMNIRDSEISNRKQWVTKPINRLPWSIMVKYPNRNMWAFEKDFGIHLLFLIILTHVFFLLIKYLLLKKQAQDERRQIEQQKLELVGTLAASTAHEIRNPLTGIKGLLQLLGEKYHSEEDHFYFEVIDKELNRINEIVSEFLILGKPTAQRMDAINIGEILLELKPLIETDGNTHNSRCVWYIPPQPVIVECIEDQMKQVILNLTKNAFEAIEIEGIVKIKLFYTADTCNIEITDNGKGMSREEINKIFYPFYTSKDTGTGLGLVVCKRIVTSIGGHILVSSAEGVGTTFTIVLPLKGK